jgi:CheY-like chemotaxis protein
MHLDSQYERRTGPAPFFRAFAAFGNNLFGAHKEMEMILIADDDVDFAENCSMMLESFGYDVSVVLSAAAALAKISDRQPDLLISDCCMPEMGGLQLSEQLKARPAEMQFPILLMSGSMQCRVAHGTSYDAFLSKPFLAEDLLLEVRKLLQNSARHQ